uniref:Uncharacterized protein n=1 Tax=Rhizophora mucronata TaxID=61149 RepID=A0A2P2NS82_RHIMU
MLFQFIIKMQLPCAQGDQPQQLLRPKIQ